ncbi:MAG: DMT family transporter [Hyphomicrobiales bacterium]|nr:DMT family transporter [Hyphomicrobiales bacterium]
MLGGILALLSAATFAFETATARRGVLTASVAQALSITVPLGVPIFILVAAAFGALGTVLDFSAAAVGYLALAGILHFVWGRYCNYRASKAMGANLVAPVQQCNLIVTLVLAIWVLGEHLTALRILGLVLVVLGPAMTYDRSHRSHRKPAEAATKTERFAFKPNYAEGYLFALLSASGYGVSPVLVRLALESGNGGLPASLGGGLISYTAATATFALLLLLPGQWRHVRAIDRDAAKWFTISGVCVCLAQMLRYMALALAPVSVVTPIQRLSLVFRLYFGRLINPQYEVFGGRMIAATFVSLAGALALSVSTEAVQSLLRLPDWAIAALNWRWP